jgi:hypothetical protein
MALEFSMDMDMDMVEAEDLTWKSRDYFVSMFIVQAAIGM